MRDRSDPLATSVGEGFEDFYAREFPGVVGLAYALSGNRAIAEDLAQEAFLAAHRRWGTVGRYDEPGAWVRRVVSNLSVSAFRRRVVEAKALGRIGRDETTLPELTADDLEFWRAVRSLPRRQAQVVALFYLEDRPVAEVAVILDMAPGTVKKHLHDGRRALARRLSIDEEEP
ncbi:MAG: SigE family RNA polymerase sigma factor [Planctomycetaceae bacterium]